MSLRLILFLLTTYGYAILIVAHTYGLICMAQGIVGSSQRDSLTFGLVMVQELRLFPFGSYVLNLPNVFCLNLEDCYYVPALTKNNVLVSCLNKRVLCNFMTMVVTLQCQLCWWNIKAMGLTYWMCSFQFKC